jgi:hypothetical protein
VADVHDVTEITGRYLTAKDAQISDESLERVSDSSFFSWHSIYWFFVIMLYVFVSSSILFNVLIISFVFLVGW